jgi:hypothetical protein
MKHWAQRLLFFCWKAWGWEGEKNSFRATALWEGFIGDLFLFLLQYAISVLPAGGFPAA